MVALPASATRWSDSPGETAPSVAGRLWATWKSRHETAYFLPT
jgi:hypothetical protein